MSTWRTVTPKRPMPWCRKENVQPYSVMSASTSSPGSSMDHKVAVMAPMPEPNTTAAAPCSRLARRPSSRASVGLAMRL